MIYLWISLAAWIIPGIVFGARHARNWYAEAFKERIETVAEHNRLSREKQYHSCYLGPYRHGNNKKCYRTMPTHSQAVRKALLHVLVWPFVLIFNVVRGTINLTKKGSERLGNSMFGNIEEKVRESFRIERVHEKEAFMQEYAEQFRILYFSHQMITEDRESTLHNIKVDDLLRTMMSDENRPKFLAKDQLEEALTVYRHDPDSLKSIEGSAK